MPVGRVVQEQLDATRKIFGWTNLRPMNSHGTTHRCLLIPEILSLVCAAVSLDDVASSRRLETLAALARTSRLFQEPALDCLWSELSTIAPLVKCMPSDLWREERVPNQRSSELVRVAFGICPRFL